VKNIGPINSIVLSRTAESDNVYIQDTESVTENGLCELKIIDNQIMNGNDRSDYLQGLLDALDGLYYYINDINSIGIMYYDIADLYNIQIGETAYQCIMLNDEINVTTGIQELIHTEMPEQSETDYTKADKTDRRLNQTYLIVDKQNQIIEGVVSNVEEQNEQIAEIRLQYNELLSKISDIADITTSGESSYASVNLVDVNTSQPISIKIKPITTSISYTYPMNTLYPSDTLYMKNRILRFRNTTTSEIFYWEIPTNLWYYNSTTYDELELSYGNGTNSNVIVTRRCTIDSAGTISPAGTETTETYSYPTTLVLTDGDYIIDIPSYSTAYLYVQLMAKNIYTTQFYTKAETNSLIDQTASSIDLSVNQKLSNYSTTTEMNSAINLTANQINSVVSTKVGNDEVISKINQSSEAVTINANKISLAGKQINLTGDNTTITSNNFSVDKYGNITATNANISGTITSSNATITGGKISVSGNGSSTDLINIKNSQNNSEFTYFQPVGAGFIGANGSVYITAQGTDFAVSEVDVTDSNGNTSIQGARVKTPQVIQTSLESEKKNFEKLDNGLNIIKVTDIYKYNLKSQKDGSKKHIGFVIGDKYKYSEEITSENNDGVDTYSMIAVAYKAIQEQQEEIEQLREKINKLEGGK
jgi:hypothetical protein